MPPPSWPLPPITCTNIWPTKARRVHHLRWLRLKITRIVRTKQRLRMDLVRVSRFVRRKFANSYGPSSSPFSPHTHTFETTFCVRNQACSHLRWGIIPFHCRSKIDSVRPFGVCVREFTFQSLNNFILNANNGEKCVEKKKRADSRWRWTVCAKKIENCRVVKSDSIYGGIKQQLNCIVFQWWRRNYGTECKTLPRTTLYVAVSWSSSQYITHSLIRQFRVDIM